MRVYIRIQKYSLETFANIIDNLHLVSLSANVFDLIL